MYVTVYTPSAEENTITSFTLHPVPVTVLVGMVKVISFILHLFPARLTSVNRRLIDDRRRFQRHVMFDEMLVELLNG